MNEQLAFTVTVTGCMGCPHRVNCECSFEPRAQPLTKSYRFHENKDALTNSCPMYDQSKPIGELK